jgi:DNA-binding NtrC family response regulator/tetratricopeptide (TPR) repeat protein
MPTSFETFERLFDGGEYAELLKLAGRNTSERRRLEPRQRVLVALAAAFVGELREAQDLAAIDRASSSPAIRARAETALAISAWRNRTLDIALQHAGRACAHATDSGDARLRAWTALHLFRLRLETESAEEVSSSLGAVRTRVTAAGDPQATAYLHNCVAVAEGHAGRLDQAARHLEISRSMLDLAPNHWVAATVLVNAGCLEVLRCDLDKAAELLAAGRALAGKCGYGQLRLAAETTLGGLHLLTGQFDDARKLLTFVLETEAPASFTGVRAAESLARVCLAEGNLDASEQYLAKASVAVSNPALSIYYVRWAALTHVRLMIRRGNLSGALALLRKVEGAAEEFHDQPLLEITSVCSAHVLGGLGRDAESARRLVQYFNVDANHNPELQPYYHYACSSLVSSTMPDLSKQSRERAERLWRSRKIVSLPLELTDASPKPNASADSTKDDPSVLRAACAVNAISSFAELADRPRLLAAEAVNAIRALGCSTDARVIERETAVNSSLIRMRLGQEDGIALDLVCSPPSDPATAVALADVLRTLRTTLELARFRHEERNRAALWPADTVAEQDDMLFLSEEMQGLLAIARRVGPTPVPVLITGETGTGKEVLARTIHACSSRPKGMFLPFNCTSTPRDMLDSQLFGHRRGSFTGATEHFLGVIRTANGGSLFLDEIGDMNPDVQPKLLRFLESGEVHPVGEAHPLRVDVRLIAATNADLDALVAQGRFREDLFYRLNVVRLHLPPLRERRVEIPTFAAHYLRKFAQECGKTDLRLAEETMEYLVLYRWPGNVRQLANEMRRLAALAEPGAVLMPEHLATEITAARRTVPASQRTLDPNEVVVRLDQPHAAAVEHLERALLLYALKKTNGRIEDAAQMLGLSRKGLYLKRQRFGIQPPEGNGLEAVG